MNAKKRHFRVEKIESGIPGLDTLSEGGWPKGRGTLAAGTAGSAKTIFASIFNPFGG